MHRLLKFWLVALSATAACAAPAQTDSFPSHPIRMVMPFTPGGPTDMVARVLAQNVGTRLGQSVIVENRAGANGIIGTQSVAKAAPDGYTLLIVPTSHTINPNLYKSLPYDTLRDFRSVVYVGNSPGMVLVVSNGVQAGNAQQLVALASAPGHKVAYGSAGNGNLTHLAGEFFNGATGASMLHVPYKGAGEILSALYSGEIQAAFLGPPQAAELIKTGKLRGLAVTSAKRMPQLPELPTMAELGYPGYEFDGGIQAAIYAPAATPTAVVERLNREFNAVLGDPAIRARFEVLALDIAGGPPEVLDRQVAQRMERYAKLLRDAKVPLQ